MMYGDGGAGKTTLLLDIAAHFATGRTWCGLLEPVRPLNVGWIENEGPRPMMRAKLRVKLATWGGPQLDGRFQVLDEPWAGFSFRDELHRLDLTAALDEMRTDLLIVGPLGRIGMEGAGTTDDIRDFLAHVEASLAECASRPALLILHHENRAGQISGAWEREPDTLIHVQGQGKGRTRVFWQKARWASDLHATSTQLVWAEGETFTVDQKPAITDDTIANDIIEAVRDLPGASWTKIRARVTGSTSDAARVRDRLLGAGVLLNTATREGYFNLTLPDDPTLTRSELGTGLERLSFPSSEGAPAPSRSTVL